MPTRPTRKATRAKKPAPSVRRNGALSAGGRVKHMLAYLHAKAAGKRAYEEADRLLLEMRRSVKVGEGVMLPGGAIAEIFDAFADRDVVYKPCGVNRYGVKVTPADPAKRRTR